MQEMDFQTVQMSGVLDRLNPCEVEDSLISESLGQLSSQSVYFDLLACHEVSSRIAKYFWFYEIDLQSTAVFALMKMRYITNEQFSLLMSISMSSFNPILSATAAGAVQSFKGCVNFNDYESIQDKALDVLYGVGHEEVRAILS